MLSIEAFIWGFLLLAMSAASLAYAGRVVQVRYLPQAAGPEALVVTLTSAFGLFTLITYSLGAVGLFREFTLAPAFIASGPLVHFLTGRQSPTGTRRLQLPGVASLVPLAVCLVAGLAVWLVPIRGAVEHGLIGTDSLMYHLPFALYFHQNGSLMGLMANEPVYGTFLYPALGSIPHAVGMEFFDRDFLSILINPVWAVLAVLAGGAIGYRKNVGVASAIGVLAPLLGLGIVTDSAGGARVDVPMTFFFLAAAGFVLRVRETRFAVLMCGAAVGMGISVKLTLLIPAVGVALAVMVASERGSRTRNALIWGAGLLATSWVWLLRNVIESGSPFPYVHLPFLGGPIRALEFDYSQPVIRYAGRSGVLLDAFPRFLVAYYGELGTVAFLVSLVAGIAVATTSREREWNALGVIAVLALVGYFFTPASASGPPGGRYVLDRYYPPPVSQNPRYMIGGLCLGLALLPVWFGAMFPSWKKWLPMLMSPFVLVAAAGMIDEWPRGSGWAVVAASVIVFVACLLFVVQSRLAMRELAIVGLLLLLAAVPIVRAYERAQVEGRHSSYYPFEVHESRQPDSPAVGGKRVALVGTASGYQSYLLSNVDLTNRVEFLGERSADGSLLPVTTCQRLRQLVNEGRFDVLVVSPNRMMWEHVVASNPQLDWIDGDPNTEVIKLLRQQFNMPRTLGWAPLAKYFQLNAPLSVEACDKHASTAISLGSATAVFNPRPG